MAEGIQRQQAGSKRARVSVPSYSAGASHQPLSSSTSSLASSSSSSRERLSQSTSSYSSSLALPAAKRRGRPPKGTATTASPSASSAAAASSKSVSATTPTFAPVYAAAPPVPSLSLDSLELPSLTAKLLQRLEAQTDDVPSGIYYYKHIPSMAVADSSVYVKPDESV